MRTQASSADRTTVKRSTLVSRTLAVAGLTLVAGCGSSVSSEFAGSLFIETCSLACTDGTGGVQVNCGVVNVTENVELSVLFSEPINGATITPSTLQVIDVGNGTAPEGLRFVDPLDPRRVIFRPAIDFESGGVSFSLERNRSYEIRIPGAAQGDAGPFIMSTEGNVNQSRLLCTVFTSEGVADIVPGNPQVAVFVDVVTAFDPMGNPIETERQQIGSDVANAVENVSRSSQVIFEFNELMNLPTVASVVTGESLTIFVELDTDGDISTAGGDRIPIPGSFELDVDQFALTTTATFTPFGEIPSAGINRRLLVVRVTTAVRDIANLPVTSETGGGVLVAVPEILSFTTVFIPDVDGEGFDMPLGAENENASGGLWGNGLLAGGLTGGSGRHGSIVIDPGETLELDTDSQTFPLSSVFQTDVIGNGSGMNYPSMLTVTDGVFELSSLRIAPTGRLILKGSNPARLVVRGRCVLQPGAIIDVSGESAPPHDSTTPKNIGVTTPPAGGPNGSAGGLGGDRADFTGTNLIAAGGIANPGAVRAGQNGDGVGGSMTGRGLGGPEFPVNLATESTVTATTIADMAYNIASDPLDPTVVTRCIVQQLGGSGSGAGYARPGGEGSSLPVEDPTGQAPMGAALTPGPTPGGDNAALGLAPPDVNNSGYTTRLLRWQSGDLRGGGSGGGGGNHPFATFNNSAGIPNPMDPLFCIGDFIQFVTIEAGGWKDHSGASGGAGGGALEVLAGRDIDLDGFINAAGGSGGSSLSLLGTTGSFAMPGGGGSGGSLRIRAPLVDIGPTSQLNISGGVGGSAPWSLNLMSMTSLGGVGSPGLIRVEDANPDALTQVDFDSIRLRVLPINPLDPMESLDYLSVAPDFIDMGAVGLQRPDSLSGSTSCWIRPAGNFLQLVFREDTGPNVADQGWTMDVVIDDGMGGTTLRPYRGASAQFPTDWESQFGNMLGYNVAPGAASPIVVRFQGGRSRTASLVDPCNIDVNDPFGEVLPGSLTPWVAHPADIGLVVDPTGANYTPNMIRYTIMFDTTDDGIFDRPGQTLIDEGVLGVDNVLIIADPD